ncbi:MAG: MCE family protein [Candidatus Omnitrophica bacterium]|nr:MCE family protein [Candidatus Omnitrophota bacterium]
MFRDEKLEMKVGLFIGIGLFVMFFIVFSISDFYVFEKGYNFNVIFDYVNGITSNAPVRLAGVHVGDVEDISIYYDDEAQKTRVKLNVWVKGQVRVERDAVARINTLGLLGEQYLELTPGKMNRFLEEGDTLTGKNPVNVGVQMERVSGLVKDISEGRGTLGKLLTEDTIYNDLEGVFGRLNRGEGTIGKLLVEEDVYDNIKDFTKDIKAHPWKLLHRPRSRDRSSSEREPDRGTEIEPF